MKRFYVEVAVGLFVALGLAAMAYLSVQLGQIQLGGKNTYILTAVFPTVAGLREGAAVEIAGVQVGRVQHIRLQAFEALVTLRVDKNIGLPEDSILSIRTRGLIGERYLRISEGGSNQLIAPGGRIREVETPLDFEDLIGQFVQGKL